MEMRRAIASMVLAGFVMSLPAKAQAAPDPVIASLLSAGSTLLPLGVAGGLLLTGRGASEGIRYDLGLVSLGVGAVVGPSIGQIYGNGGVDAVIVFILRAVTSTVMLIGAAYALRGDEDQVGTGKAFLALGGIPTGLLALWDIYGASVSARESSYREGHAMIEHSAVLVDIARCGPIPCPR
jgi:hypothetical protein